jgi:hypothetical protein
MALHLHCLNINLLKLPLIKLPGFLQRVYYVYWFIVSLLYLTPGEHRSLPAGCEVVEVIVRIYQRNLRVAFETNAANYTLATLNQNKNGLKAIGLHSLPYIDNRKYSNSPSRRDLLNAWP